MSTPPTNHETIKSYLLGQIPEPEESGVEERLFTDREFYDELSIVEDELIDQYLGGALSDTDRKSFESHFVASPERQQKVRFARALKKYVSVSADQDEPLSQGSASILSFRRRVIPYAIAAAIIVVVGLGFLLPRYLQRSSGRVLAVELLPGPVIRSAGEVKQFSLAPDVGTVRLQLYLPRNEYQTYEAVVRDASLRDVYTAKNLKPETGNGVSVVTVDVEADLLAPGDYRVNLSGTTAGGRAESVATFSFTVRAN